MSQHSEDRLEDAAPPAERASARILPFERPQSELQRAIQLRAQQSLDIERDRDREANKPAPLRWLIIFLIALIPVVLIFGAVDGFLRAFYRVNEMYKSAPPPAAPEEPVIFDSNSSTPGVVILQPYEQRKQQEAAPQPTESPSAPEQK